jgi:hypothetical protein
LKQAEKAALHWVELEGQAWRYGLHRLTFSPPR